MMERQIDSPSPRHAGQMRQLLALLLNFHLGLLAVSNVDTRANVPGEAILGEMSGTLAHELNQPLAAIMTKAQTSRDAMDPPWQMTVGG